MINVKIKYINDVISELEVKGHSNFAPKGSDIVCAGVSAIVVGGINADQYFFNYGTKELRQIITSSNPHTRLVYSSHITIERGGRTRQF